MFTRVIPLQYLRPRSSGNCVYLGLLLLICVTTWAKANRNSLLRTVLLSKLSIKLTFDYVASSLNIKSLGTGKNFLSGAISCELLHWRCLDNRCCNLKQSWSGETRRREIRSIMLAWYVVTHKLASITSITNYHSLCCTLQCAWVDGSTGWWSWVLVMVGVSNFGFDGIWQAWFPNMQERIASTGHLTLVQIEFLLELGGMSLELSSVLGFYKRVLLAWIRVLVLSIKPVCEG